MSSLFAELFACLVLRDIIVELCSFLSLNNVISPDFLSRDCSDSDGAGSTMDCSITVIAFYLCV